MRGSSGRGDGAERAAPSEASRKRAAVETYARHESALRRTARRYSLCADDAEDALQRGLEILLRKAPSEDPRELIKWTQTVVKHEALAVRRERERLLAGPASGASPEDWVALIPSESDGPPERAERREAVARSREALRALKPQELRALTLLAEGFSYAEIGARTGWTRTKINRCLAEGRDRFRAFLSSSEDGSRCAELGPAISAFCDGEAGEEEIDMLREHLRACSQCRSTMRAYRAAPAAAAALAPSLPLGRSLLDRAQELVAGAAARFGGGGSADSLTQIVGAGGARGAGAAALAKAAALCVGAVGGAACLATGFVPVAVPLGAPQSAHAPVESRPEATADSGSALAEPAYEPPPPAEAPAPQPEPSAEPDVPSPPPIPEASAGAVEYEPPPVESAPAPPAASGSGADPAGEFGP
jgi:RNA polymerase sigma factor (sigma-70 family)